MRDKNSMRDGRDKDGKEMGSMRVGRSKGSAKDTGSMRDRRDMNEREDIGGAKDIKEQKIIVKTLTIRSLKKNRGRNLAAILAIIMTAMMFTT